MNSILDMSEAELDVTLSTGRRAVRLAALNFDTPPATGGDLTSRLERLLVSAVAVTTSPLLADHASDQAAPVSIARQV